MPTPSPFSTPSYDYGVDVGQIERRRALAQALQSSAFQPIEQQPVGPGQFAVPSSPMQGFAKLAQALASKRQQDKADKQQRELTGRIQSDYQSVLARGLKQLQGTPATAMSEDASGNVTPAQPAVAPDPGAALATFGSHPGGAQFAPLAMQGMQRQQLIQALGGGQQTAGGGPQAPSASAGAGMPTAAPQTQAGRPGGPAGGIPMEAWLATDPTGKSYMEQLAKDSKPIAVAEGGALMGPGGNIISVRPKVGEGMRATGYGPTGELAGVEPIPGHAQAAGGITAAQEAARAGYDMVTVPTPQGPRLMTKAQAVQMSQGGAPQQAAVPVPQQQPTGNLMPVNVPQEDMPAWRAVASGQVPAAFGKSVPGAAPVPTPAAAPAGGPGIPLQDVGAQKAEQVMGEGLGKRYNEIQDAGFTANGKMNKYARLGGLLERLNTGKLAPAGFELAAWAKDMGMPVDAKLDNAQASKAIANELALELRNPSGGAGMPGAMSDADREYLRSMLASLDKTPGANKLLIEGMTKMAERERDVARLARDYKRKNGKFDDGFYDELQAFSEKNPLFEKKASEAMAPVYARNPTTGARIVSTDGGKTWSQAK